MNKGPNEEQIAAAQAVLKQYIAENGTTGTDTNIRRCLYSIYSVLSGVGSPAQEFEASIAAAMARMSDSDEVGEASTEDFVTAAVKNFDDEQLDKLLTVIQQTMAERDDDTDEDEDDANNGLPEEDIVSLDSFSVDELRDMAAQRDIKGRSSMNKAELVEALSVIPLEGTNDEE